MIAPCSTPTRNGSFTPPVTSARLWTRSSMAPSVVSAVRRTAQSPVKPAYPAARTRFSTTIGSISSAGVNPKSWA